MTPTTGAIARAFHQLLDVSKGDLYRGQPQLFALTWLAAGRMVIDGEGAVESLDSLADPNTWKQLVDAGFPAEAIEGVGILRSMEMGRRARCVSVLADLYNAVGKAKWDVLPLVVNATLKRTYELESALLPSLATYLVDLLGVAGETKELWIPFDGMGQLAIEALRRGWTVRTASPSGMSQLPLQLLLIIETGHPEHPRILREVGHAESGILSTKATHVLVVPPFGASIRASRLAHWDTTGAVELFARSESWAIYEFINRATERAVFAVPSGVLFSRGQEERLRDYLLHRGGECNELEAVIALPIGVFASAAGVSGAAIIMTPGLGNDTIEMAVLGGNRRSIVEADEILKQEHDRLMGNAPSTRRSTHVSRDEIAANENSLAPSRYLRRVSDLGESVRLGDVCEAVRPPSLAKEETLFIAHEVGMADLNVWRPIESLGPKEKAVHLRAEPKPSALLRPGDIVVSIKGSIGKASIIGTIASRQPLVPSQSCLALRLQDNAKSKLWPEYLLMYLRSEHGLAQMEGLQVGTAIQHVSPNTLLSLAVPLPTPEIQAEVRRDFDELCALEDAQVRAGIQMTELRKRRWTMEEDTAWA